MKTKILFFVAVAVLAGMASTFAQGGTTGLLTWNLKDGTLTISGSGAMPDYLFGVTVPWDKYKDDIHTIVIENGVSSIGVDAFNNFINLTTLSLSNSVLSIGVSAFEDCTSLTSIIIPNGLKRIEQRAFLGCVSLNSVIISGSVIKIASLAFACINLKSITNLNPVPLAILNSVFSGVNQSDCILEVPANAVAAYQNAEVWKEFNIVAMGVGDIETDAFNIYPNPTTGELRIENGELKIEKVEIFDVMGKWYLTLITSLSSTTTIDISDFQKGVYFVKMFTERGVIVNKIIKY